jgi:glycosyltransferase involved in cell wall biosynthesis
VTAMAARTLHLVPRVAPVVVLLDPGNFTPYYVDALCVGLHRLGLRTRVIASPPLFDAVDPAGRYPVEHCFFPSLAGRLGRLLRRRTRLRQVVKAIGYPAGVWRTWRLLRREPAGVLHVQWALVPLLDGLLARALRARGWRVVYTVHDPLPGPERPLAARHQRCLLPHVDALIVHTPSLEQALVASYPELAGRVQVIPHGGVPEPLPTEADRARARLRLGLEPDGPLLLLFGMLKPYKGIEDLLAALPAVLARMPRCRLVVAGEPLMPMQPVEQQIDRLGLRHAVTLRPAFVPQDQVAAYFTAADLVLAPYREIAASGVVVTAQGHARAVVVTRVGGLPEFVEPDSCGLVVPPRDPAALAEAICRALADPDELARMGQRARHRIAADHDWTDVARKTLALYQAVPLTSNPGAPSCRSSAR